MIVLYFVLLFQKPPRTRKENNKKEKEREKDGDAPIVEDAKTTPAESDRMSAVF